MKKILLTQAVPEAALRLFPALSDGTYEVKVSPSPDQGEVLKVVSDFQPDGILVRTATKLDRKIITAATKLRVIGRTGVGVDNIDVDAATERNIPICNTPDANSQSVAEHTVALMLAISKNLVCLNSETSAGNWKIRDQSGAYDLSGKRLGLVGFGKIAVRVATISAALGMQVYFYDPYVGNYFSAPLGTRVPTLEKLIGMVDVLSLHVPLTDQNKGLIDYRLMKAMPQHAILINTARGPLINEKDLIQALDEKWFTGVGLDVFTTEPLEVHNRLNSFARVIKTPHSAALTAECRVRMAEHALDGILNVLEGHQPKWIFNRAALTAKTIPECKQPLSSPPIEISK